MGSYALGDVDIADVELVGGSGLIHEVEEQYQKQVKGLPYGSETSGAHGKGIVTESEVAGAKRGPQHVISVTPYPDGTIDAVVQIPYTYPGGKVVTKTLTIKKNNVVSVTEKLSAEGLSSSGAAVCARLSANVTDAARRGVDYEIRREVDALRNGDIKWDAHAYGLAPQIMSSSGRRLLKRGDAAVPALLNAIDESSQFVAAYVLLTLISGVHHALNPWNTLQVDLRADGSVQVDESQRTALGRRWRQWFKSSPRPASLPE